jgi:hypothetical protein
VTCGRATCEGVVIPVVNQMLSACCPPDTLNTCGLDVSLLSAIGFDLPEPCQARDQPGNSDPSCPNLSQMLEVPGVGPTPIDLSGCCRAETGTCGYVADRILVLEPGLGCIESGPFLEGGTARTCTASGASDSGGDNG